MPPRWALRCVASRHGAGRAAMGSNLREALDTLLVALLAKALLDAELRLGRVDERAFDRRGDDRDATRALELADEWQQRGLAHLAGHVDLAEEQHLWSPVLRVERNLLELEERLPCAVVAQPTQRVSPLCRHFAELNVLVEAADEDDRDDRRDEVPPKLGGEHDEEAERQPRERRQRVVPAESRPPVRLLRNGTRGGRAGGRVRWRCCDAQHTPAVCLVRGRRRSLRCSRGGRTS